MHRVLVVFLATLDALVTGAVGIAAALAPLTLLWVFALASPAWGDLWPAASLVWQLGHFVPVTITLPGEYLAVSGIPAEAGTSCCLSLRSPSRSSLPGPRRDRGRAPPAPAPG